MPLWMTVSIPAVLLLAWFLYITRHGREIDSKGAYNRLQRGWRRIAFWAGDVCILGHFPWVTWDKHGYRVSVEEMLEVMAQMRAGDVLLTRHEAYPLSNLAIPGCFKHAAFVSRGPVVFGESHRDVRAAKLIEAVSEGVMCWSPLRARADRMILLRPKNMEGGDIARAVFAAQKAVGCDYDADFQFNIEEELEAANKPKAVTGVVGDVAAELKVTVENIKAEFDMAFSCTEAVAFAWWHKRAELRLFRRPSRGRNVIVADQFVNNGFAVVWTNVTSAEVAKAGMHEEGVGLIEQYWKSEAEVEPATSK